MAAKPPLVEPHELLYPSNLLTLLRLLLLAPTHYYLRRPGRERAALLCLGIAMLTDMLDGPLARSRGEVSQLGMLLDPLADKLTIDGFAVAMSRKGLFPWWASVLLIGRDLVILGGAALVLRKDVRVTPPTMSGKVSTVAFTVALLAYALGGKKLGLPAMLLALIPYAISCAAYARSLARDLAAEQ